MGSETLVRTVRPSKSIGESVGPKFDQMWVGQQHHVDDHHGGNTGSGAGVSEDEAEAA